jgi:hypothetical protein
VKTVVIIVVVVLVVGGWLVMHAQLRRQARASRDDHDGPEDD